MGVSGYVLDSVLKKKKRNSTPCANIFSYIDIGIVLIF